MKTALLPLIVLGLLLVTAPVMADILVDQQQLINNAPSDLTGTLVYGKAQGFTPTANNIVGVELYFDSFAAGPNVSPLIDVEIYNCLSGSNTLPDWDAGVLGQGSRLMVFPGETPGFKEFLLDSPASLVPGNNYSIVIRSDSQQRVKLGRNWTSPGDPYVGGGYASWHFGDTNATAEYGDVFEDDSLDMAFKTLYEDTGGPTPKDRGDVTEDLFVGADDLVRILSHWGESGAGVEWSTGDCAPYNDGITTGDQFVGADDYVEVLTYWGTDYSSPEPAPEPATLGLLSLSSLVALKRRQK